MKDKISVDLSGISCGGFCRIKNDEVCCEMELLGLMGLLFPHMTSQFPHLTFFFPSGRLPRGNVYVFMHVCVCVCMCPYVTKCLLRPRDTHTHT